EGGGAGILPARPRAGSREPFPAALAGNDGGGTVRLAARLAALLAVLALAGCVSQPMRAPETVELSGPAYAAAMEALRAREALVEGAGALSFSGRVAISNGEDGGSGRLEWWQAGE